MVNAKQHVITIAHLYPKSMNVYGDMGNVITLRYRLEKRGFLVQYEPLDSLQDLGKANADIVLGGGGQDSNQGLVQDDLIKHKALLQDRCQDGMVGLMICGMYQMLGHRFVLPSGEEIAGAGILNLETRAGNDRLIGNVVISSPFGQLVGFENHSGRTYLGKDLSPLGTVVKGAGNNGEDATEGVIYNNIFGTYLHGPALAKNPGFADELIKRALVNRGIDPELAELDDSVERKAAAVAMKRPR